MFPSWEKTSVFSGSVSWLVLMLEVQIMKKVALQEEKHTISPSAIRNCLVQLNDLSHFLVVSWN